MIKLGIEGKVALVLGAGGGLGEAISSALASEGVRVAVADIDPDAAQKTATAITNKGGVALAIRWDLADLGSVDGHIARIEAELGAVDVLVNNTGGPPPTPASGQEPALWRKHFDSMVLSVIAITDRVLPGMRQREWGASSPVRRPG